jgi:hypothetical protein
MKERKTDIYYDITITEKNTGNKLEGLTLDEMREYLGISSRQNTKNACANGKYKNYIITSKKIEDKTQKIEKKPIVKAEPKKEEEKPQSLLKYCFEAYRMLENGKRKYNFDRIEDFIDWLRVNEFVFNELK